METLNVKDGGRLYFKDLGRNNFIIYYFHILFVQFFQLQVLNIFEINVVIETTLNYFGIFRSPDKLENSKKYTFLLVQL